MKKLIVVLFAASFLVAGPVSAQMGMMSSGQTNDTNISAALQDIYKAQNVNDQTKVDCSKITDDQFEKLGDASMGAGISEQQHTAMEQMMGGEGSATLKSAHITMGRSYLGCWSNYNGAPSVMPMMSNGLGQNTGMMARWSPAANHRSPVFMLIGLITLILVWGSLVLSIMALLKWLSKNK